MSYCQNCQKETPRIRIAGRVYCDVCGTVDMPAQPAAAIHARVKHSSAHVLDLRHAAPLPQPSHPTPQARQQAHNQERLERAKQVQRSAHINKFGGATVPPAPAPIKTPAPAPVHAVRAPQPQPQRQPDLPRQAVTQHEAMAKLALASAVQPIVDHPRLTKPQRRHLHLTPGGARTMATVGAIALMSGYIWLQNYPKLALQNASNQAGLSASLPGYLPSSYNLKSTQTSPGLVTLNFSSPSASEPLKIQQRATTWDANSLLDNFVSKQATAYSAVQGQGLTIFMFNDNQASWVNHGIWYSIAGASRLSREQILKIAYSL